MKEVKCFICGSPFLTPTTGKFCSIECKKEHKKNVNREFHERNKEIVNKKRKEYYKENIHIYKERDKKRHKENILNREMQGESVRKRLIGLTEKEKKDRRNKERRKKYKEDKLYSLKIRIRSLINKKLRDMDLTKSHTTEKYLGCDIKQLMSHLEKNFINGMSWENRDDWQIDHIVPISRAKNEEEFILLSHYTNLQPMWAEDNLKKSNDLGFHNVKGRLIKKFGVKGEYQQYRYETSVDLNCFDCGKSKTSKLVVVFNDN